MTRKHCEAPRNGEIRMQVFAVCRFCKRRRGRDNYENISNILSKVYRIYRRSLLSIQFLYKYVE